MRTIYKYPFEVCDLFSLQLPINARIVLVEIQKHQPCIWAEVQTENKLETRWFNVFGTGHPIPDNSLLYVASFQSSQFVWHLYEVIGE